MNEQSDFSGCVVHSYVLASDVLNHEVGVAETAAVSTFLVPNVSVEICGVLQLAVLIDEVWFHLRVWRRFDLGSSSNRSEDQIVDHEDKK